MNESQCASCVNSKCYQRFLLENHNDCNGYIPSSRFTISELYVVSKLLKLTNLSSKYSIVEMNEKTDGLKISDDLIMELPEGISALSEDMPDDNKLRDEFWVNDPEIDIWNKLKTRLIS